MQEVDKAKYHYKDEKITGPAGKRIKCLRSLGKNGAVFETWLGLLPDGDYGSSISGAFKLVLNVRVCLATYQVHTLLSNGAGGETDIHHPRLHLRCVV